MVYTAVIIWLEAYSCNPATLLLLSWYCWHVCICMVPGSTCMTTGPSPELKLLSGIQRILTISMAEPWISSFFPRTLEILRPRRLHTSGCKAAKKPCEPWEHFQSSGRALMAILQVPCWRGLSDASTPLTKVQWGGNITHDWIPSSWILSWPDHSLRAEVGWLMRLIGPVVYTTVIIWLEVYNCNPATLLLL